MNRKQAQDYVITSVEPLFHTVDGVWDITDTISSDLRLMSLTSLTDVYFHVGDCLASCTENGDMPSSLMDVLSGVRLLLSCELAERYARYVTMELDTPPLGTGLPG